MQKIKAILVDDEESARDVLENLLKRFCPQVELLAKCENIPQAVEVIRKEQPQLVFLDIEMPMYAGFEIVDFFKEINFDIIFVTAYDQYAVRAFEVSAVDYLLKPINIDRLKKALEKVSRRLYVEKQSERLNLLSKTLESKQIKSIAISEKSRQYVVQIDDIIAIQAMESYCIVHTNEKKYIASKNLRHFEILFEELPLFIRTHKSWMINKRHMQYYSKSNLVIMMEGNISAKLSKYKRSDFESDLLK